MRELNFSKRTYFVGDKEDSANVRLSWQFDGVGYTYIWQRDNGAGWVRNVPPRPPFPEQPNAYADTSHIDMTANLGVLEALATNNESYDPNDFSEPLADPTPPLARVRCIIVKGGGAPLTDGRIITDSGGTWVSLGCHQEHDPVAKFDERTFAILEVDKNEPVHAPDRPPGFLEYVDAPLLSAVHNYDMDHGLLIANRLLFPGHAFWGLLTLVNHLGDWNTMKFQFVTSKRKVVINFDELHIINDGSEQHNDAAFRVWVAEGWQLPHACHIPELEITDRPTPGDPEEFGMENIKLIGPGRFPGPITLGPKVIEPEQEQGADNFDPTVGNELVAILAYGVAEGDGPDPADRAANFDLPHVITMRPKQKAVHGFLFFPIGPQEALSNSQFEFFCEPQTANNEFEFSVIGTYSVSYVP